MRGGNCYVRDEPGKTGAILGVAHDGDRLSWLGRRSEDGWLLVDYHGRAGWVSGKYGRLG